MLSQSMQGKNADLVRNKPKRKTQHGNSRTYILARLESDRPDLFEQFISGKLSANAAAIEAGWKQRKTPLDAALDAYRRLNDDERRAFWRRAHEEA